MATPNNGTWINANPNAPPPGVPASFWSADVAAANTTGANPWLLAAIAEEETGFGTAGAGRQGFVLGYHLNSPSAQGLVNQLLGAGKAIEASTFQQQTVNAGSLRSFANNFWEPLTPQGTVDPQWAVNVWNEYHRIAPFDPLNIGGGNDYAIPLGFQATGLQQSTDTANNTPGSTQIASGTAGLLTTIWQTLSAHAVDWGIAILAAILLGVLIVRSVMPA